MYLCILEVKLRRRYTIHGRCSYFESTREKKFLNFRVIIAIFSEGGTGEDRSDVTPLNFRTRLQIQEYLGRLFEKKSVKFSEKNCSLPQIKSVPPSLILTIYIEKISLKMKRTRILKKDRINEIVSTSQLKTKIF